MFQGVMAGGIQGMQAYIVRVEVDMARGLPGFELVGSVGKEIKEARERVSIAMKNGGYPLPVAKITVNLSPANIKKEGTGYDLAVTAGLLACMEVYQPEILSETAILGELALNGEIRGMRGVLPIVLALQKEGIRRIVVPYSNRKECSAVPGIRYMAVRSLEEFVRYLQAEEEERARMEQAVAEEKKEEEKTESYPDFSDVTGQEGARRMAEIAAAGAHHLLLAGPPGAGKTMIARRIPGILPTLTRQESMEVSSIYSIAGKLECALLKNRPFLAPHHTTSPQALAGGGRIPAPGLLSLAHRGVLFLDEMPEFPTAVLEVLRQPMEEKKVQIARSHGAYTYPADFMLVCAMNPCPCGYFPNRDRCRCTEPEIRRYLGKISGPIMDRIDIVAEVEAVQPRDLQSAEKGESSAVMRDRVLEARARQARRYKGLKAQCNGELSAQETVRLCVLGAKEQHFMEQIFENGQMSMRSYHKTIKLARTVADLAGADNITTEHLAEAVCFGSGRKMLWR